MVSEKSGALSSQVLTWNCIWNQHKKKRPINLKYGSPLCQVFELTGLGELLQSNESKQHDCRVGLRALENQTEGKSEGTKRLVLSLYYGSCHTEYRSWEYHVMRNVEVERAYKALITH